MAISGPSEIGLPHAHLRAIPRQRQRLDVRRGQHRHAVRRPHQPHHCRNEHGRILGLPEQHLHARRAAPARQHPVQGREGRQRRRRCGRCSGKGCRHLRVERHAGCDTLFFRRRGLLRHDQGGMHDGQGRHTHPAHRRDRGAAAEDAVQDHRARRREPVGRVRRVGRDRRRAAALLSALHVPRHIATGFRGRRADGVV